jgi:hypothetical protein
VATEVAGASADVDNPICMGDHIDLVFDHEQRIDEAEQIRAHLSCQSQALQFTGESVGCASGALIDEFHAGGR